MFGDCEVGDNRIAISLLLHFKSAVSASSGRTMLLRRTTNSIFNLIQLAGLEYAIFLLQT
jgi:hypothetical protein